VVAGDQEVPVGGDIIIKIDGAPVTGSNLSTEILKHKPGDRVKLDVIRQNRTISVELTLGSR
jgi:S1-C subfamily serine protease